MSRLVLAVTAVLLCFHSAPAAEKVDWWESATLYHIYPRSFQDSDGDGMGDINGITARLPYLKKIGVTVAWLSPIYKSPMVDMGYDISNFTDIDPLFGTLADFDAMLKKAHKLRIKIILDFVPNHSSDECEWFQKSIRREEGYDDLYVWEDGRIDKESGKRIPPNNWKGRFYGSAWEWNDIRQQYYLHMFYPKQPDFDLTNPKVIERLTDVMKFWLDRGVDGFRVDAVPFYVEKRFENGTYPDFATEIVLTEIYNDPEKNAPILFSLREFLDKYQQINGGDTRAMIAESYEDNAVLSGYISNGTHKGVQMPLNLNFVFVNDTFNAKTFQDLANSWMDIIWKKHKVVNWSTSNHDNKRVATMKGYNLADLLTIVYHALPGTCITYYGEEIGMTDGEVECSKDVCDFRLPYRTPMQWDTSKNAGFSKANSTWLPVNPNYSILNVQAQRKKDRSTLKLFMGMVRLKKTSAFKAFKEEGGFELGALNDRVFHIMRTDKVTEYRVLANIGNQIEHIDGLTNKTMEYVLMNSYSTHKKREKVDLSKRIYLWPYEAVVLRWTG